MANEETTTQEEATEEEPEEITKPTEERKGAGLRFKKSGGVCRICRRAGEKLFLKGERCYSPKCAMTRRSYPPGQHGSKFRGRQSQYATQLREKQKLSAIYGVRERPLIKYYREASKVKGKTGEKFLELLERRLDNVIFRAGFAPSRRTAKQIVSHGKVKVNKEKTNIPSFLVEKGDKIQIKFKKENKKKEDESEIEIPSWLRVDKKTKSVEIINNPERDDIKEPIEEQLIVEFYSK